MLFGILLTALVTGAGVFCILALIAIRRYRAVRPPDLESAPPVSILKPLAGLDEGLEENLRTYFTQDYPLYEILFGVRGQDDPAVAVVKRLQAEYPDVPSRILITGQPPYANAKVFSLSCMFDQASYDLLVMSDSDVRVTPSMLKTVAAEFQDSSVGVATCPYRAVAGRSFWSRLEAIGMNTDFVTGILVARMLDGMKFAVGPTIVARKAAIETIGGFDRLKDYLAEDYVLGRSAADSGIGVILSSYVIEHRIGSQSFRKNLQHRLRWCRSTRRSRPGGYAGQLFTMPAPLALALLGVWPAMWPLAAVVLLLRIAVAASASRGVLKARINWWMLPVEDFFAFAFWIGGFFGNTIAWRGRRYKLLPDGRFELLADAP